jgi:4-amino-4-deoxychorismate lyase
MYRLVESIRIENRQPQQLVFHNRRFNAAVKQLYGITKEVDLGSLIEIPEEIGNERYKLRILFDGFRFEQEISLYIQRIVNSLRLVKDDTIDYSIKTENRDGLDCAFSLRGGCDDIIIVKNNHLTDSWAANIILFDGNEWVTPDTPLLKGTQREYLLSIGKIKEAEVRISDLLCFKEIKLINAMVDFERAIAVPIENVKNF